MQITTEHLAKAAKLLGKSLLDSVPGGRQALLLSDQSFLHRLTLGAVNRDVNPKWIAKLRTEMNSLVLSRERTTMVVCVDIRDLVRIEEDTSGFRATVLDGQHRFMCLKELCTENPQLKYDFWLQLYIVSSEAEKEALIHDLDRRLVITPKDKKTIQDRRLFSEAFLSLIPSAHHTRRCVTRTLTHKVLRTDAVVDALQNLTFDQLVQKIKGIAAVMEADYRAAGLKSTDAVYKVIQDTKMYQLVNWESGEWIQQMLGVGAGGLL